MPIQLIVIRHVMWWAWPIGIVIHSKAWVPLYPNMHSVQGMYTIGMNSKFKEENKNDIDNGNIIITQCPWHKKKWRKTTIRDFWIVDIVLIVPWLNYYRLGLDKVNSCFQSGKCYSIPLLWPILLPWISYNPSNHMPNKVLIKTRYPFTNFNGPTLPKLVLLCKCFEFILR